VTDVDAPKEVRMVGDVPEATLLKRLMIHGSTLGLRLFRNQVGSYQLKDGRYLTSGLCVGSSDLIGYLPITITPDMVGKRIAVFVAIEAKGPRGRVRKEQQQFVEVVAGMGGIAAIVRSVQEVAAIIAAWKKR